MTHTPTETIAWIVRISSVERYGPFKSPDDARAFATQTGQDYEICQFHGRLVRSWEIAREEYELFEYPHPFLYDPSEYGNA
jgi:hypothetical protein